MPDSRPVRIGNGAVDQRQTDVLGEVMAAPSIWRATGDGGRASRQLVGRCSAPWSTSSPNDWQEPDNGLWEIRGPQRHFTHSRVMVWVAFDEVVRAVETARPARDRSTRGAESATRSAPRSSNGASTPSRNSFVQHYDTEEVDASLLLILSAVGFLPGDDPRMLGTIEAVEHDLIRDGLVLRYRTETGVDGLDRATSIRSSPARSGWSSPTRAPADSTTRTR